MGLTFDDFPGEGGGGGVKSNADFFPKEAEEFGMVPDFLIHDDFFDGGKSFERTEKSVGAGSFLLFKLRGIVWVSRRLVVFATGGFLLFCLVLQERVSGKMLRKSTLRILDEVSVERVLSVEHDVVPADGADVFQELDVDRWV